MILSKSSDVKIILYLKNLHLYFVVLESEIQFVYKKKFDRYGYYEQANSKYCYLKIILSYHTDSHLCNIHNILQILLKRSL